jgi:hypothetical protein
VCNPHLYIRRRNCRDAGLLFLGHMTEERLGCLSIPCVGLMESVLPRSRIQGVGKQLMQTPIYISECRIRGIAHE